MLGFALAVFMGFTLGLLGGGGGILTVPILVFAFGLPASQATGASLLIVGIAASIGAAREALRKNLNFQAGIALAMPAMAGSFAARAWVVPALPENIRLGILEIGRDRLLLTIFAIVMWIVAWRMISPMKEKQTGTLHSAVVPFLGLIIGVLSGILGAGGGFLIVPALVLAAGMEAKAAAATSLLVIALQSLIGYAAEIGKPLPMEPVIIVLGGSVAGMLAGLALRSRMPSDQMKTGFAWFIIAVGIWTLAKVWL